MQMQTENVTNWKNLTRQERGELIFKNSKIIKTPRGWRVPSQSNDKREYLVRFKSHKPQCECPDCEIAKKKCKHIYAVELYLKREIDQEGKITETKGMKITYGQKWKAYDKAQTNEKLYFMELLSDLCRNIKQPEYKFGRPTLPIQDMIFSSVMKVYSTFSLRRFMSDVKIAKEKGYVGNECTYVSISNFMNKKEITPILKELIKLSSLPLSSVEKDFAVDSSGFGTSRFARYFDYRWGKDTKHRVWLKAHLVSGVKSNIVVSAEITEGNSHDSPQLAPLLKGVSKEFNLQEVSCDRAYSSRENLKLIQDVGAVPYIPFKSNTSGKADGSLLWKKMYHYFLYKHEEFLEHYHKRSNSETVFHMIKTKFKDSLRNKNKTAQINELLCKVLCHNICVVIQEISELGIRGKFIVEEKR